MTAHEETDLETAVRLLNAMKASLDQMVRDAPIVATKLAAVYADHSERKIFHGLSHLNYGSANAPTLVSALATFTKSFEGVHAATQRAHTALSAPA